MFSLIGAFQAQAQTQVAALPLLDEESQEVSTVAEIVVTGTAIRGVAPVGSATVNISQETLVQSGVRDASAFIAQLPQGSTLGNTLANNSGRSAGVNLRGLGNNATLILFDGHRTVAQGIQSVLADPNMVPFGAIERVEVVTDGASAVYGSDAVAGVVNYILRRPFDGAEVSARYTHTLYKEGALNAVLGKTWSGGGVLFAAAYEENTNVRRYDVPQLRSDVSAYGGNDNRFLGTTLASPTEVGALIAGGRVYGLPDNLNGRTPTAGEVAPLLNNPALIDSTIYQDYYTARSRLSTILRAHQDLGRAGEISATAMFNQRTNSAIGQGDGAFQSVAVTLRPDSPYYVSGLASGNQSMVYNFRLNNPDRELNRNDYENTGNILVDYRVDLFGDFRLTASGGWGMSQGCATCQPQANTILTSTIANPATASLFNPYLQGPQAGAEGIFGVFIQKGRQEMLDFGAKIDGRLFSLPAGDVRIAVGSQFTRHKYQQHSLYSLNPTTTTVTFRYADVERDVYSAYGEAFVPIVGDANSFPLVRRLDLSMAVRYDEYSDFGGTTNPKIGLTWKPTDDLLIRSSWGTSFRAPTLSETSFNVTGAANRTFVANNLNDPNIPVTNAATGQTLILTSSFRFAQLRPETADVFSIGADYTPSYLPGLKLGATYYSVDYQDRISGLPAANTALSSPEAFALYKDFFTLAPQPGTCVNGSANGNPGTPEYATYNPIYLPYLNANGSFPPTTANDCQLVGILDTATRNLGRVKQSGVDLIANYRTDLSIGTLSLDGSLTKVLDLERNLLPGAPLFSALDVIGEQISERGRAAVGLRRGAFFGNLVANYLGGYLNNQTPTVLGVRVPHQNVPSWTTFDVNMSYEPEVSGGALSGTRFNLSIRNFTDKDPPVVLGSAGTAADLNAHSVFGRIVTIEVSKHF